MSTRTLSTLALLVVLSIGVGIYFVLEPSGTALEADDPNQNEPPQAGGQADPIVAAAESEAIVDPKETMRTEAAGTPTDQTSTPNGHRIRVIDIDGTPLAGVQVHGKFPKGENGESDLEHWANYPDQLKGWRPEPSDPRSNAQGIVTFSESSAGAVAAVLFGKVGHVLIQERIDGDAAPIDLQLREIGMVKVSVIRADDSPVIDRLVYGQLVDPRDPLTPEGEPNFSLRIPTHGFTDGNGVAWLPLALPIELRDVPDIDPNSLLARAETREHLGNQVGHNFAFTDHTPIELRLPPNGKLHLRLDGYPVGVRPTLSVIDPERNFGGPLIILRGKATEDPLLFEFADLPFAKEFKVRIDMPRGSGGSGSRMSKGSGLPGGDISGPTESEPFVERVLTMSGVTGLFGRFILEEGAPIQANQLPYMTAEAKGFGPELERAFYTVYLTVFEGGEFFARLRNFPGQNFTLDSLSEVQFGFVQAEDLNGGERGTVIRRPVVARVPLALPQGAEQADLGTIVLQAAEPLLIVRTLDQQGQALPGVSVRLSSQSPASRAQDPKLWENQHFDDLAYTDASGEYWVTDRDWASELRYVLDPSKPGAQADRIRVDLNHPGYLGQSLEIPINQSEVEVRMEAAGSLAGSVLRHPALRAVGVEVVAPGQPSDAQRKPGSLISWLSMESTPDAATNAARFEIDRIPSGTWDVCFSLPVGRNVEVLRVSDVHIEAGELNRDSRLDEVDLSTAFTMLRIQLLDESGAILSPERDRQFLPTVAICPAGESFGIINAHLEPGDWMERPIPIDGKFDIRINALEFKPLHRSSVSAGEHRWVMQRAEPHAIKINGLEKLPSDSEWTIAVQWIESGIGQRQRFSSTDGPEFAILFHGVGSYLIEWRAPKLTASGQRSVRQTIRVTQAMIDQSEAIEITVPPAVIEALRN